VDRRNLGSLVAIDGTPLLIIMNTRSGRVRYSDLLQLQHKLLYIICNEDIQQQRPPKKAGTKEMTKFKENYFK
jgi:hypothetical protein